jgi:hypothetical protein
MVDKQTGLTAAVVVFECGAAVAAFMHILLHCVSGIREWTQ